MTETYSNKNFIKTLIYLALPIILQSLVTSSLNLLDNLMIGSLGENSIAAVGLSNQFFFFYIITMTGVCGGTSIFMSQLFGKKDILKIKTFLGINLSIGFIISILFALLAFCFPRQILLIFTNDLNVINDGTNYLKVVALSYIFTNITQSFSAALRSTRQTKVPMYASLIGLLCNAVLNWIFIFGHLGAPKLGVAGAALGTTFARLFEMLFILFMVYKKDNLIKSSLKELKFDISILKKYFKVALPVIINDVMWVAGTSAYVIAYGKIGVNAVATIQISNTVSDMFNIFGIGIATATAIIIGNSIGENRCHLAIKYARKIEIYTPILASVIGLLVYLLSPLILSIFNVTPETYSNTLSILKIMALLTPLRFFNLVMIIGVFRGGGDVNYAIFSELFSVWGIAVPAAFIGACFFHLPVIVVFLLVCLEEIVKFFFEMPRFLSNKWVRDVTSNIKSDINI